MPTRPSRVPPRLLFAAVVAVTVAAALAGCSSVPKEVVELSYLTGRDLRAVHQSYDQLIHQFYENLRDQRRSYLDDVWYPRFLANWRDDGELVGIARGDRVWSDDVGDLVDAPPGGDEAESLKTLQDWVQFALYAYDQKEQELIADLDADEAALRADVRESFDRLGAANMAVTAHLNSLREVQEVQDEMLEALDIKDLRDDINARLAGASDDAAAALARIRELDAQVDDLADDVRNLGDGAP